MHSADCEFDSCIKQLHWFSNLKHIAVLWILNYYHACILHPCSWYFNVRLAWAIAQVSNVKHIALPWFDLNFTMHAYCTQAVTRMPTHRHTPRGKNEGHNKYAFCSHLFVLLNFACGLISQDPYCVCFGNFNIHLKWKPFHHILPLNWVQQLRLLHPSCHLTQKMTTRLMVWLATSLGASTRAMLGAILCNS